MTFRLNNSQNNKELKLDISPSFGLFNKKKNQNKELKSSEKEKKFYKEVFPRIITENLNSIKIPDNNILFEDKKIKGISLSVKTYNKYMVKYNDLLKYPSNDFYLTDRIKNYIPFNMLKNINLNKKSNFYSTFNDFDKKGILNLKLDNNNNSYNNFKNKNNFLNQKKFLKTTYINKDKWMCDDNNNPEMNDNEILKYFIEGTFLYEPSKIKKLNINEKNLHPHILNKNDFIFYEKYLENLQKNENFTEIKTKEYEMSISKNNNLKFMLELRSICLFFEEIEINTQDIYSNNDSINTNKEKKKNNIQKIYLPFKYLALFFLLSYTSLKAFISEIISLDIENNKFQIKMDEKMEKIVKKYANYCQNKINLYNLENNESIFKDIIYYQNEFHFNYIFPWIIYDNRDIDKKIKCFKLKIILPTICFQPEDYGIIFQQFTNKWLILELIKNNFIFWDRYLLYNLFLNKKLRNTISYILNKKRNHISYEYTIKTVGPIIDDKIANKNNFDFFITVLDTLDCQNHYYFFSPFKATISSKKHGQYNLNDSICLILNDSRKIYKLAKHFGLIATFNKCMFYNQLTKKYYFTFKFLKDITQDYMALIKGNIDSGCSVNKKCKQVFRFNGAEYHLIIRECLLSEKIINQNNFSELKYFKIPYDLLSYILENEIYNDDIFSIFIKKANKFINIEEIEEYREFFLKKNNINDSSSSISKTSKDKNKKKGKKASSSSLNRFEINKNSEKKLIQLKNTNKEDNKEENKNNINNFNQLISELTNINKNKEKIQKIKRMQTLLIKNKNKNEDIRIIKDKKRSYTKIIKNIDFNKINIDKLEKSIEYRKNQNEYKNENKLNINNKKQLQILRIKRSFFFDNSNNFYSNNEKK